MAVPLEGGPGGEGVEGVWGGLCGGDHFISTSEGAFGFSGTKTLRGAGEEELLSGLRGSEVMGTWLV